METLYYNLSEEEFSKSRKILLWIFVVLFFIGGISIAISRPLLGINEIDPAFSIAPFGISLIVGIIALLATLKRKDIFFSIDDDKIEFRYGLFNPKKHSFRWAEISKIIMPHKERKVKVCFSDGTAFIIDLTYLQRKKATNIWKHIYYAARSKNLVIEKVIRLR